MPRCRSAVIRIVFILSSVFIFHSPLAALETREKEERSGILVIGSSRISAGNPALAQKNAISEAIVKGVEAYLRGRLGEKGMIDNFPRIIRDIIPAAKEQIENYHILAEERSGDRYEILVRLKMNEKVMEEKLRGIGLTLVEGPPVKVLFLVSQLSPFEGGTTYWWGNPEENAGLTPTEVALYKVFQERGFSPINRLLGVPEGTYSPEMRDLDLSDEACIGWGRLFSADVIIHGKCEILENGVVQVNLKAFEAGSGAMIYQDSQTERAGEAVEDLEQVVQQMEKAIHAAASRLDPEMLRTKGASEEKLNQLELTLNGLTSLKQFMTFKDFLMKEMEGVKSVIDTRLKHRSISVSVEFTGSRDRFLEKMSGHEAFPFRAEIDRKEGGEILINIK